MSRTLKESPLSWQRCTKRKINIVLVIYHSDHWIRPIQNTNGIVLIWTGINICAYKKATRLLGFICELLNCLPLQMIAWPRKCTQATDFEGELEIIMPCSWRDYQWILFCCRSTETGLCCTDIEDPFSFSTIFIFSILFKQRLKCL